MTSPSDLRASETEHFLTCVGGGWERAMRSPLGQDASTRSYVRLFRQDGATALLMDAPIIEGAPCPPDADRARREAMGWNAMARLAASRVEAFVLIADHLRSLGFRAPEVYAYDVDKGFALLEDFGEGREFARVLEAAPEQELTLYTNAAGLLAKLHRHPVPDMLEKNGLSWPILEFDSVALGANADLYADWLPAEVGGQALSGNVRRHWEEVRDALIDKASGFPRVLTLRDYHAENLLWLPGGEIGLLDFQDAVRGWDAWDMTMLTQDARREVSPEAADAAVRAFLDQTGQSRDAFEERFAVIGALNALRLVGVFSRLQHRDGKGKYARFQPRQFRILAHNLAHPSLKDMRRFVMDQTPFVFEGAL